MAKVIYANVRDSKLIGTIADLPDDDAQRLVRTGQARVPSGEELAAHDAASATPTEAPAETPAVTTVDPPVQAEPTEAAPDLAKANLGRKGSAPRP